MLNALDDIGGETKEVRYWHSEDAHNNQNCLTDQPAHSTHRPPSVYLLYSLRYNCSLFPSMALYKFFIHYKKVFFSISHGFLYKNV